MKNENESAAVSAATKPAPLDLDSLLWKLDEQDDLGTVSDSEGSWIACTYLTSAKAMVKAHNEAVKSLATKPAPAAADIEKAASAVESYGLTELAQRLRSGIATKPAEPVIPAPRVEDREELFSALLDAANYYLAVDPDPNIMVGLKDRQTFVGIGTKAAFTMMCDGRSGRQLEEAAHLARQAQPTDRDAVRDAALEEAALACEAWGDATIEKAQNDEDVEKQMYARDRAWDGLQCAEAIRALKGKSGSEGAANE